MKGFKILGAIIFVIGSLILIPLLIVVATKLNISPDQRFTMMIFITVFGAGYTTSVFAYFTMLGNDWTASKKDLDAKRETYLRLIEEVKVVRQKWVSKLTKLEEELDKRDRPTQSTEEDKVKYFMCDACGGSALNPKMSTTVPVDTIPYCPACDGKGWTDNQ